MGDNSVSIEQSTDVCLENLDKNHNKLATRDKLEPAALVFLKSDAIECTIYDAVRILAGINRTKNNWALL